MLSSTNGLVGKVQRYVLPAALSASVALGAVAFVNHTGVHAAGISAAPLDDGSVAALTSLDTAMEALAARVTPAVVNISVTSAPSPEEAEGQGEAQGLGGLPPGLQQFFGGGGGQRPRSQELQRAIGSGVIISPDGYILTNNHVVEGAKTIRVTLHDRRILSGRIVGTDKLTDLAVVKVDAHELPAIAWGDSARLQPGQTVLAFGSPFGYLQFSVTRGIVSAVGRENPMRVDARAPGGYIQTDAAINPGNSGGPLVNAHGELVGINTLIATDSGSFAGAGFAIPAQTAHAVSAQLIAHGVMNHGYLGISMNDVTPDNAHFFNLNDASGAIVAQVTPDSPAAKAGVQQGDVITALNGGMLANSGALQVAVSELAPGTGLTLTVVRNAKPLTLHLTVGEFHAKEQVAENGGETAPEGAKAGKLGLAVADLTANTRQQLNIPDDVHGAVVENVREASPADEAGLQPGDVILQVNRQPTTSASQFVGEVHDKAAGQDLLLLVWSRGNASYRTLRADGQNG